MTGMDKCFGAKPPSQAALDSVAFPSSTAECNSPNAFQPPGELDKDQVHPDRGPRFSALKLLPFQVCWLLGITRLEFALALFTRRR